MLAALLAPFRSAPPEAKASRTAALVTLLSTGAPRWTPRDYASLAREGYAKNAIAFRAVRLIAEAVAALPLVLMDGAREVDRHPLLDLVRRPNPRLTGSALMEAVASHLLVAGNAYVEAVAVDGRLRELHVLRPDRMRVVPGPDGWPEAFDYVVAGRSMRLSQEPVALDPDGRGAVPAVLHVAAFNPLDDHYGFAPLEAAAQALDLHNAASAWNKALIDNAARPSGALVYGGTGTLTDEQFDRLKGELENSFQGALNAGRPLLLEGGLDWRPLSLSPKDMDFEAARNSAAREIALAIGVPPLLMGIPGDSTYANYTEANRALWRQSVIPMARRIAEALVAWLGPAFGGDLALVPDVDQVEALAAERTGLWSRVGAADFLTSDEKRAAVGYGARDRDAPAP